MIFVVVAVLVVGWMVYRRAMKRRMVAGLTSDRPGFFIEPPAGRLGSRKDKRL